MKIIPGPCFVLVLSDALVVARQGAWVDILPINPYFSLKSPKNPYFSSPPLRKKEEYPPMARSEDRARIVRRRGLETVFIAAPQATLRHQAERRTAENSGDTAPRHTH